MGAESVPTLLVSRPRAARMHAPSMMNLTHDRQTPASPDVISPAGRRLLQLQLACDIGPIRLRRLLEHFGSADAVFEASRAMLERVEGIGPKTAAAIRDAHHGEALEREIARATVCGVRILSIADSDYPRQLLQTPDAPACLYVKGSIEPQDAVAVAIVGTRRCSQYGREQALRFGELLGSAGFTVVSGLARGIDGLSHEGALRGGGRTIAVLGNGLASVYPPEHEALAGRIAERGALISELPMDAAPDAKNFPGRNRVIAGLSLGVVVIEAGQRSGALITARHALDYNREVFAVPGRVDNPGITAGVNGLIREGSAKLVTSLDDILDELQDVGDIMRREVGSAGSADSRSAFADRAVPGRWPSEGSASTTSGLPRLPEHEQAVVRVIREGSQLADAIALSAGLELSRVLTALTSLEIKGVVRRLPGDRYTIRGRLSG